MQCRGCSKHVEKLHQCGRCYEQRYCDRTCQKKDWPAHKKACRVPVSVGTPVWDADGLRIHVTAVPHYDEQEDRRFIDFALRYWPPGAMKFHSAIQVYDINTRDGTASMGNNEFISLERLMELAKKYIYNGDNEDEAAWRQRFVDYDTAGAFLTLCYFTWWSATKTHCNAFCLVKSDGVVCPMQREISRSTFVFTV